MVRDDKVALFQRVAREIPGYKHFLDAHNFKPATVTSLESFHTIPICSKKTYLNAHVLKDIVWEADLQGTLLFCSTSGSTGEPYYFPRNDDLSHQYADLVKNFLENSSYGHGKTLVLNAFGMGVWIGGVLTLRAFEIAGQNTTVPVAILPTGYNKKEIFKALKRLSPQFEQTIITGYPPFIKELVDEAPGEGIDLSQLHVRFLFAAEAFTETFRDYVCEKAGISNPLVDTLNIYGTADIGAMAYETPLSILIRRLAVQDPLLYKDLFGQVEKTPTLAQYNPDYIEFEAVRGEVVLTADAALPLIRYAIGDHGGTLDYEHIKQVMHHYNIDLDNEIQAHHLEQMVHRHLPFVYVYERSDFSVTLHGIIIYPEFIKESLLQPMMAKSFTERFTMLTKNDIHHNQFLEINLELQKGVQGNETLEKEATDSIRNSLIKKSSEFAEVARSRLTDSLVKVIIWPNGHPRYFTPDTKQKWVEK